MTFDIYVGYKHVWKSNRTQLFKWSVNINLKRQLVNNLPTLLHFNHVILPPFPYTSRLNWFYPDAYKRWSFNCLYSGHSHCVVMYICLCVRVYVCFYLRACIYIHNCLCVCVWWKERDSVWNASIVAILSFILRQSVHFFTIVFN